MHAIIIVHDDIIIVQGAIIIVQDGIIIVHDHVCEIKRKRRISFINLIAISRKFGIHGKAVGFQNRAANSDDLYLDLNYIWNSLERK